MTTRRLQQLHPPESAPVETGDGADIEIAATSPNRWEGHVQLDDGRTASFLAHRDGQQVHVWIAGESYVFTPPTPAARARRPGQPASGDIVSPVPGVVMTVLVAADEIVEAGQDLVIIESMKTEHLVKSPRDGTVERVLVQEGEQVERGVVLVVVVGIGEER
ncbi:MAG: acetyl-CoA carboxylase biotin carboxyl carrier protein subunit [Chloroflexi bacterium]|nr:acetyl-CoA carboxylase biotin carboxyl carrier protein subunit [Dehalococcoidia bacterium]PKB80589.1 MAG: acetyl-CoA carboxylase biotin carboxyl carrier protein subunit [SAR202 cluster bacterium MP-SInd-SRR3963457-G1]PKB84733.1 MAG: acetyl-CoA carboxylase biotin carboxyl carrier protein subunit [SAR202 cluster bacterium MP-NPac-SRR3961935-G1]RUA32479.1 MAG: acetyl-CoA carboxylase biotin carboxyl carrier protein subunit [Chloroflexota bacterium]